MTWRQYLCMAAVLISANAAAQARSAPDAALRRGFASPPQSAKLRCYWWWLNGNTDEAAITRDLTEMSRKGFGGVLLVDGNGSNQRGNDNVPPGPEFGSAAWTRLYVHALKTAAALHLEVTLNIASGWNLGGPDVKPAEASKLLTWSRTAVDEAGFNGQLAMPPTKNGFYRQIAVLAYPLAHGAALPGEPGSGRTAIAALPVKEAAAEMNFSMPASEHLLGTATPAPDEQDTQLDSVLDVTARVNATGLLTWTPPSKGAWEILRIGYTDSDARVSTSSGAWQGLAIDYLDRTAFDTYWTHTVDPLLQVSKPYLKTTLVNLATDSWELGGTNWTGRFAAEFKARRGYDPTGYLPVVAGRIVTDRATSERFLNDLRRTVGDLVTDHYDHFAERAHQYGLGIECESGGPHGAPFDGLETFRSSAVPQTEFWAQSNEHRSSDEDRFFTKEAASAADIYGKKYVAQEGMTSIGPQWSESLATDLKPSFDRAATEGMNRLVWHEFTSSPAKFGLPGNEYFAGTHLNPNVTWWPQSDDFFLYLNRTQFLMQQGHAVDDVLYFYGDEVPNFVRLKRDDPAHVLPGYDYDVTDEDALLRTLAVRDGGLATPGGNVYKLLAMPRGRRLSVASLERIGEYVRQGGSVVGERPLAPTGIVDDAAARRFVELTAAMWDACPTRHSYGKGIVFCTANARDALKTLKVVPDFEESTGSLDYVHRSDPGEDIYFVRNGTARSIDTVAHFRVAGRKPELWNAVDGSVAPQMFYESREGRTHMPLHLDPFGSVFVVFARAAGLHVTDVLKSGAPADPIAMRGDASHGFVLDRAEPGEYQLHLSDGRTLTTKVSANVYEPLPAAQWTIAFQSDRGAPVSPQTLEDFSSWSQSTDPGVRYFSGTAAYKTEIDNKHVEGERVFLMLSDVREICTVRLNGKAAGTIWAMPYRLDITDALRDGGNTLELDVTNLWPNRIVGDAQPGVTRTYTRTNIRKYTSASPLLPSGLIGPVTLERVRETIVRVPGDPR